MKKIVSFLIVVFMSVAPATLSAETPRLGVFGVEARIYSGDVLIGNPQIRIVAGSEVAIGVSRPGGYGMRITVDEDQSRPRSADPITVNAKVYFVDGREWVLVGAPEIQTIVGATTRQSSISRTVYGDGGYAIEVTVNRTDQTVTPAEFSSVENCPLWKSMSDDGPLRGVRVQGAKVSTQSLARVDLPYCCTVGNLNCCGSAPGQC